MHKRSILKTTLFLIGLILLIGFFSALHVAQEAGGEVTDVMSVPRLQYQDQQQTVPLSFALPLQNSLPLQDFLRSRSLGTSLIAIEGGMEWNRTYDDSDYDTIYAVIQTMDGGYALAGSTHTSETDGYYYEFWLVKTDTSGNEQWTRTYFGSEVVDVAETVIQTADGGYALAGSINGSEWTKTTAWLVKTDANGIPQWNQTYGGHDSDWAKAMIQTVDGGFALVGWTRSYGAGEADFWLVKTDARGAVEWNQTYGGTTDEYAYAGIETTDGGFALAGSLMVPENRGWFDAWLVKTYPNGTVQWNQTYGGSGEDNVYAVIETADGGYALAGETWSYGVGESDFWLMKTDPNGKAQWNQTYGGSDYDTAYAVTETPDGGFALVGTTRSSGTGGFNGWLVKTDDYGDVEWTQTYGGSEGDFVYSGIKTADSGFALAGFTDSFGTDSRDGWLVKVIASYTTPLTVTPAVTVLSPNGGEYWNGTQTINWAATDPQGDPLTYSVYYSSDGGQTWTQLATGLTESSYLWDTTTVENGVNCLIQVEASDGTYIGADASDTPFEIANEPMNTAPVVYVIQPNGGDWVNGTYEIQWSATDPNGDALTFTISYSPNGGDTWTQLDTGVSEPSYPWDTTTVMNGTSYLIRVEAYDGTYTGMDVSDTPFEIANEPVPFEMHPVKTQSTMDVTMAAAGAAISGVVLLGAAVKATSIPPPLPGMRSQKDFLKRLFWYLCYSFVWLFGHVIYPPVCRRLNKADVTTNSTRQAILHLLRERGVAYLREIERSIDSGFFGLMWHLQVLEDFGHIRQIRIGKYRVYYLKEYGSPVSLSVELGFLFKNKNTRAIINYIRDHPGTYQAEIARTLGLHHTTVRYYLQQIIEQKLLESFSDGRRTRYFLLNEKKPQVNAMLQHVQPEGA
ncbi:MAG: winged helix-turn-helix transcriptional regulator [Candidatus Heimdallarchaeota archaeon]